MAPPAAPDDALSLTDDVLTASESLSVHVPRRQPPTLTGRGRWLSW
jgi:hypothetical protein